MNGVYLRQALSDLSKSSPNAVSTRHDQTSTDSVESGIGDRVINLYDNSQKPRFNIITNE
jgi:hypothetical protein